MSYQVLARKWRPQKFSELVGQEHVVTAISNALDNNKLHHAYLFTGTRGVGKTTIARIFSKSLNCESGQGANPCGVCNACMDIDQGRYVDLLEIDAASRTKVEDTRELLDNVQYKPTRGRFKVYLIDEVHMLSKHSFNALLKTLEEPPPHVKFLLATTDPQKLPITILSRCLQFSLKALTREQIQSQLKHVLNEEKIPSDEAALSQLARAAQGSMRDALSLTDQAIAQGNNRVEHATVISMLGLLDKNQVLKLAKSIIEKDATTAMQQLDDICMHAPDYAQVISELLSLFHQISLTQIVPEVCKIETVSAKAVYQLSKAVTAEHIQLLYQIALQGKKDLPFAPDALTGLQMTLMRLLAFSPQTKVELDINEAHATALEEQTFPAFDVDSLSDNKAVQQDNDEEPINNNELGQAETPPPSDMPQEDSFPAGKSEQQDEQVITELDETNEFDQQMMAMSQSHESSMFDEMLDIEGQASDFQEHAKALIETYQSDANQSSNSGPQGVDSINALLDLQADAELVQAQQPLAVEKKRDDNILDRFMGDDVTAGVASDDDVPQEIAAVETTQPQSEHLSPVIDEDDEPPFELDDEYQLNKANNVNQEIPLRQDTDEPDNNEPMSVAPSIPNITAKAADIDVQAYLENGDKLLKAEQIDAWSKMVEALSTLNVKGLNKQLLLKSNLISTGETVTIKLCSSEQHLNEPLSQQSIVEALCEYYGKTVQLNLEIGEVLDTPEQIQKAIDNMRQSHAENIVHTDETIQEIIKAFDGRIVSGSIVPT